MKLKHKIIYSIIAILFLAAALFLIYHENKGSEGKITITLVSLEGEVLDKRDVSFSKDDTLYDVLKENYDIIEENGMLLKINELETLDTSKYFIKIYLNEEMANRGIKTLKINDGDKLSFVYTKTGEDYK